jgi:sugar phosphate permease
MTGVRSGGLVLRVLLPFAFGYLLSYLFRTINAVIAPDLIRDFSLTADDLGLLTGAYFLTFAAAQLPLGIALDRFGSRRTEAVLLLFAAAGAVVFARAADETDLFLGRALIGIGVSACLMAAFKAFVVWFPTERLPLVNGMQMAAGGLGAIAATTPVEAALTVTDWRGVFLAVGALTIVCSAILLIVVPDDGRHGARLSARDLSAGIGRIFASSLFWRTAPVTVMSQASFLAIQSLWAGRWLATVEGLSRPEIARTLLLIAAAMIAGFLFSGWATVLLNRRGVAPLTVALAGMATFMAVQALIVAGTFPRAAGPWILFGFFGTTGILPYAALSQRFPKALAGRLNTAINVLVFVTAFAAQWGIGWMIEAWRTPESDADAYRSAFAVMLALQAATAGWFFVFRRERIPAA